MTASADLFGHEAGDAGDAGMPSGQDPDTVVAAMPPVVSDGRTFAGLPLSTVILGGLLLLMTLWSAWMTRELLVVRSHRVVSVSLARIIQEYIAVEAHNGGTPETSAMRTRLYLAATHSAIRSLTEGGATVLVSEAVAGNSVPDVTPQLKADIDARLKAVQMSVAAGGSDAR